MFAFDNQFPLAKFGLFPLSSSGSVGGLHAFFIFFFFLFFFFFYVFPSSLSIQGVFRVFWFKLLSILYCLEALGGPAVTVTQDLKKCTC